MCLLFNGVFCWPACNRNGIETQPHTESIHKDTEGMTEGITEGMIPRDTREYRIE